MKNIIGFQRFVSQVLKKQHNRCTPRAFFSTDSVATGSESDSVPAAPTKDINPFPVSPFPDATESRLQALRSPQNAAYSAGHSSRPAWRVSEEEAAPCSLRSKDSAAAGITRGSRRKDVASYKEEIKYASTSSQFKESMVPPQLPGTLDEMVTPP